MLIEILAAIGAIMIAPIIFHIVLLTLALVIEWFDNYRYIVLSDPDNIAFTVKESLESGNYKVVQGIFNKRTSKVKEKEVKVMEAEDLDEDFKKKHEKHKVAIYT